MCEAPNRRGRTHTHARICLATHARAPAQRAHVGHGGRDASVHSSVIRVFTRRPSTMKMRDTGRDRAGAEERGRGGARGAVGAKGAGARQRAHSNTDKRLNYRTITGRSVPFAFPIICWETVCQYRTRGTLDNVDLSHSLSPSLTASLGPPRRCLLSTHTYTHRRTHSRFPHDIPPSVFRLSLSNPIALTVRPNSEIMIHCRFLDYTSLCSCAKRVYPEKISEKRCYSSKSCIFISRQRDRFCERGCK